MNLLILGRSEYFNIVFSRSDEFLMFFIYLYGVNLLPHTVFARVLLGLVYVYFLAHTMV